MDRIDILQARCDRFRNILIEIGYVKLENLEAVLAEGKLTPNDVRYLYGLDEIDDRMSECNEDYGLDELGDISTEELTTKEVSNENNI